MRMGLYRNIAGVNDPEGMGLTLLSPTYATFTPTLTTLSPTSASDFRDLLDTKLATTAEIQAQLWAKKNERYDYLLSHSFEEVTQAGYYVTTDNGSIFQWTDPSHTTSVAVLPIQDIQEIENERGTAGALLLHMQEPAIAKDTAGYGGGGSASGGSTTQYSDPIGPVQDLPPVIADGSGGVKFEYTGPISTLPSVTTPTTTTTSTTTTPTPTTTKNNIVPLVAIGGLLAVALAGDRILGTRSRLVFVGGVGALFYLMAKRG